MIVLQVCVGPSPQPSQSVSARSQSEGGYGFRELLQEPGAGLVLTSALGHDCVQVVLPLFAGLLEHFEASLEFVDGGLKAG